VPSSGERVVTGIGDTGPTKTCCPIARTDEYRPQVCWEIRHEKKHSVSHKLASANC
jgi:hypothetical protein